MGIIVSDEIRRQHESFLYPVVRVRGSKGTGSGTVIYSEQDPQNEGEHITLILTNHHVVDGNISYKEEWDSVLKRNIKKEFIEKADVDVFEYAKLSLVEGTNGKKADIIAYDKNHDLAILKLESVKQLQYVAQIIPKNEVRNLKLYMSVAVTGCSLAHEPFTNFGNITYLREIIEQRDYIMTNCNQVFGNSGGALFLNEQKIKNYFLGVPSRITGIQLGFGIDIMTWMGFCCHPMRIYQFFEEQELLFLYDNSDDYHSAMDRRKEKKKEALIELKTALAKEGEKADSSKPG